MNAEYCPEDYVVIGELIGDGENLCFSKNTGKIIRYNHGEIEEFNDFKEILKDTISMLKDDDSGGIWDTLEQEIKKGEDMVKEKINNWETKNNIKIPKSYGHWLIDNYLTYKDNKSKIYYNGSVNFYNVEEFEINNNDIPEDYVVIGKLSEDGEKLCFSKSSGKFICFNNTDIAKFNNFKDVLDY